MDRTTVQTWLDRYIDAWKTYDRATISDLFGPDATYRYHPYDEGDDVVRGRDAIVRDWVEPEGDSSGRDEPGSSRPLESPSGSIQSRTIASRPRMTLSPSSYG